MRHCRAKPQLLELGAPLPIAREAVTELKHLRIVTLGSSSTAAYGVSNPVYAYPAQLNIGLEKALPGVNVEVLIGSSAIRMSSIWQHVCALT